MGLSISSAFRLRNKLKERIKELTKACERVSVTKACGKAENTTNFDGKSFADTVANVSLLMATPRDFNLAIEKVNAVNKEDLITLETLKAEIAFYNTIVYNIHRAEQFRYEYIPISNKLKSWTIEKHLVIHYRIMGSEIFREFSARNGRDPSPNVHQETGRTSISDGNFNYAVSLCNTRGFSDFSMVL
jgi:hypothetical protein